MKPKKTYIAGHVRLLTTWFASLTPNGVRFCIVCGAILATISCADIDMKPPVGDHILVWWGDSNLVGVGYDPQPQTAIPNYQQIDHSGNVQTVDQTLNIDEKHYSGNLTNQIRRPMTEFVKALRQNPAFAYDRIFAIPAGYGGSGINADTKYYWSGTDSLSSNIYSRYRSAKALTNNSLTTLILRFGQNGVDTEIDSVVPRMERLIYHAIDSMRLTGCDNIGISTFCPNIIKTTRANSQVPEGIYNRITCPGNLVSTGMKAGDSIETVFRDESKNPDSLIYEFQGVIQQVSVLPNGSKTIIRATGTAIPDTILKSSGQLRGLVFHRNYSAEAVNAKLRELPAMFPDYNLFLIDIQTPCTNDEQNSHHTIEEVRELAEEMADAVISNSDCLPNKFGNQ